MPWQMPIQNAWQLHLVHQPQEHYKVIDALGCYRQFFFHAPQYARKFLFCLVHYANGESRVKYNPHTDLCPCLSTAVIFITYTYSSVPLLCFLMAKKLM